jgi:hypothetical protein
MFLRRIDYVKYRENKKFLVNEVFLLSSGGVDVAPEDKPKRNTTKPYVFLILFRNDGSMKKDSVEKEFNVSR